jgi:hypothetical protein
MMKMETSWVNLIFASGLVCFLLVCNSALAYAGVEIPVYFDPSEATLQGGQEFAIDVVVGTEANPAYNVTSDEIALTFNPAILQVESVTVGPYLVTSGSATLPMLPTIDNRNGTVSGAAEAIVGSKAAPTGTGVIWTITFRATAEGTSEVNFTRVWLAEPPGMPEDLLPVTIKNGIFTVKGGAVSPGTKSPTGTTPTAPLSTPFATSTPTPKEPGFEAAGALAGLSLIAYALLRSRT